LIIINEINPEEYSKISELVEAGKYSSIAIFVEMAIKNQLLLEKSQLLSLDSISDHNTYDNTLGLTGVSDNITLRNSMEKPRVVNPITVNSKRNLLPIWGLINRFSPAKVVLRSLINTLLIEKAEFTNFKDFSEKLASEGSTIRIQLEKFEKRSDVTRGESFKMGFPMKDAKSRQRFIDTYIGRLRGDNTIGGILGELQFAVIKRVQNGNAPISVIGLTDYGWQFAKIHSPLIDELLLNQREVSSPMCDEEILFLLNHIRKVRSEDFRFLSFLYSSVKDGVSSPQEISKVVSKYFANNKLGMSFVNSLQAGAMARLVEMRLIRIEKHGIYSSYRAEQLKPDLCDLLSTSTSTN
jgi:hypothetical protein